MVLARITLKIVILIDSRLKGSTCKFSTSMNVPYWENVMDVNECKKWAAIRSLVMTVSAFVKQSPFIEERKTVLKEQFTKLN